MVTTEERLHRLIAEFEYAKKRAAKLAGIAPERFIMGMIRLRRKMSEQVLSIIEAVRRLGEEQRRELAAALAALESGPADGPVGRKHLVESIRGKYRHIPTSSESFLNRKREDISLESPR